MLSVVDVASSAPELQGATGGWGGRARVLATHTNHQGNKISPQLIGP